MKQSRIEEIAAKSLVNCHARGVDSIMFDDRPFSRVRAFVAGSEHDLWKNDVPVANDLSVALHPHHCSVTLEPVSGSMWNVLPTIGNAPEVVLTPYKYESAITGKAGKFKCLGFGAACRLAKYQVNESVYMDAKQIHTVYVPQGQEAAWYVHEGLDDPSYDSVCYSNHDLEYFSFTGLYQPMTVDYLREILNKFELTKYL